MSKTLSQLISQTRTLINQTDSANSDFSDVELTGFINEAVEYFATNCDWPRTQYTVQVIQGTGSYALPTDAIRIRTAYFGDNAIANDIYVLDILTEEKVKARYPSWLDQTIQTQGQPTCVFLLDRTTMYLQPRPNAAMAASGKKLRITYLQYPAALVNLTDVPNLPDIYHDQLKLYSAYLCYAGKLKNVDYAKELMEEADKKIAIFKEQVENQEGDVMFLGWENNEDNGWSDATRVANYIL